MLIRHLAYFSALARERHFARAAQVCNVSQPTLSAGIRSLETALGVRLVVRGRTFLGLTQEGQRILAWAQQILTDYDGLLQELGGERQGVTGLLRLGVIPAAAPATVLLTAPLLARNPGLRIDIKSMPSKAIQQGLDAFEIDAGVTYLDNEPLSRVRAAPLYVERFVFATAASGPFAGRETVSWREAAGERLCLLGEEMQNRRIIDAVARSAGVDMAPTVTVDSYVALAAHVRSGGWSSIVPHTFRGLLGDARDIVLTPLDAPAHHQTVGLVIGDREPASPVARALWSCVQGMDFQARFEAASQAR